MPRDHSLQWYLAHKKRIELLLVALLLLVNAVANGFVAARDANLETTALWQPWLWELTSIVALALLLPLVAWWTDRYPLSFDKIKSQLKRHIVAMLAFSLGHILLMVGLREVVYRLVQQSYQFDWSLTNLLYELAKDFRIYLLFVVLFEAYRFVIRRWRGEVTELAQAPGVQRTNKEFLQQVLVKMLNQEFLIRLSQVTYIKSAGNYQELYVDGRAYPFRITQSALLEQLDPACFIKVNRSEIVNVQAIASYTKDSSSEASLALNDGSVHKVHKNYIENIPESFRIVVV